MDRKAASFVMGNYGKKPPFASFLPGISGVRGIPLWCYYVNRGQCVVSFGAENKDKAIMEFYPAQDAYQNAKRTGFRTFLRVNGKYMEPFASEEQPHQMRIFKNSLEISCEEAGIRTEVSYFTLPNEELGALVRTVKVTYVGEKAREQDYERSKEADTQPEAAALAAQTENVSVNGKGSGNGNAFSEKAPENTDADTESIVLEILDGMPAVVPYGLSIEMTKMMKELSKAWMESEVIEDEITCYRVRASMGDSTVVRAVEGANFSIGMTADGTRLRAVADPEAVFAYDSSLGAPVTFALDGLEGVNAYPAMRQNQFPCSFFGIKKTLRPGESVTLYELIGQAEHMKELKKFGKKCLDAAYFSQKRTIADSLAEELGAHMDCRTADPVFDEYCRYTFMDNALRGGAPVLLGETEKQEDFSAGFGGTEKYGGDASAASGKSTECGGPLSESEQLKEPVPTAKVFYVYSRKHGDLEREYNYFSLMPEYYSQGNGNFRDVNQNRRCDPLFFPFVGDFNVRAFYSLLQPDGYNPLGIEKITYELDKAACPELFPEEASLAGEKNPNIRDGRKNSDSRCHKEDSSKPGGTFTFTPGSLYRMISEKVSAKYQESREFLSSVQDSAKTQQEARITETHTTEMQPESPLGDTLQQEADARIEALFSKCLSLATPLVNGKFGEGYWTDHWIYNLDLIENYLRVFPEKEEELLFEPACTWFRPQAGVLERRKRYEKTENGIRQYHSLIEGLEAESGCENELLLCDAHGKGRVIHASIMEKLVMLCVTKFAALDAYGMGIEMEGGKPGWYDALNGLPGLLGSSVCELGELSRNLEYTIRSLKKYGRDVETLAELAEFFEEIRNIAHEEREELLAPGEAISFWNRINDAKEAYRKKVYAGVSGEKKVLKANTLVPVLQEWLELVNVGLQKATEAGDGICSSYFYYNVTSYEESSEGILPTHLEQVSLPHFLEGPVHALRLPAAETEKRAMYGRIKESALYDQKLSMYKVNEPLAGSSFELGRCRAFTPGWLENESVWLHMEYKYLLELLKSGLYEEFFQDFHAAAVPFLDPEVYGRSVYENSSFLASSANLDPRRHGRGFVARLSGSTAEFIHMWTLMMFGKQPFAMNEKDRTLSLSLQPALPAWLIPADGIVEAKFLGNTNVRYHFPEQKDYLPGQYAIEKTILRYCDAEEGSGSGIANSSEENGLKVNNSKANNSKVEYDTGNLPEAAALDVRNGKVKEIEAFLC
ncbi:MAG: hypothetical protein LUI87_07315 [Lachnospiraceae bacterium]|nr:hypothetical protein [Lachnospiraceae bacterium]